MIAPQGDGSLPQARRRLDYAISALIDPKPRTVIREGGGTEVAWEEPLLHQLLDAVSGQTGERSGGQPKAPIWIDVLAVVDEIRVKTREWQPEFPLPDAKTDTPTPTVIARLQAIQARQWGVEAAPEVNSIAATCESWVLVIRDKLDPEPVTYLYAPGPGFQAAACTACGERHVWKKDAGDNNRPVRQPALKVTANGCVCQACKASWEPGALRLLAAALGYPLPAGVLE